MLSNAKVNQVRRLLASGITRDQVQEKAGVGKGSVIKIANNPGFRGRSPAFSPPVMRREAHCPLCGSALPPKSEPLSECIVCAARRARTGKRTFTTPDSTDDLTIDLDEDQKRRYYQLRLEKEWKAENDKATKEPYVVPVVHVGGIDGPGLPTDI